MQHLVFEGNLAADPQLRYTPEGTAVCNLRVMCTQRRFDRATGTWHDGDTTTYDVACWRQLGVNAAEGLKVGDAVVVTANNLTVHQAEVKGNHYVNLRVNASSVAASARWHPAVSSKPAKTDAAVDAAAQVEARDPWNVAAAQPEPAAA
ncbi:MAG: single-stranded DNA-binding protein [Stackebrandtia sp.]